MDAKTIANCVELAQLMGKRRQIERDMESFNRQLKALDEQIRPRAETLGDMDWAAIADAYALGRESHMPRAGG